MPQTMADTQIDEEQKKRNEFEKENNIKSNT